MMYVFLLGTFLLKLFPITNVCYCTYCMHVDVYVCVCVCIMDVVFEWLVSNVWFARSQCIRW